VKWHHFILAGILLLQACLLFQNFSADPPSNFDYSMGPYTDEGYKTYSARNMVLFGNPRSHDLEFTGWFYEAPLPTLTFYLSFRCFGVSFMAARLPGALFTILIVLLIYGIGARLGGKKAGLIAALLYAVNYNTVMLGRLAYLEPQMLFFVLLAVYLYIASSGRFLIAAACGTALFCAYLCKPSVLIILPVFGMEMLLSLFGTAPEHGTNLRRCAGVVAGAGLAAATWLVTFALPNWHYICLKQATATGMATGVDALSTYAVNLATVFETGFFNKCPVETILTGGVLVAVIVSRRLFQNWCGGVRLLVIWLVVGVLEICIFRYRPSRWLMTVFPPVILLPALVLSMDPRIIFEKLIIKKGFLHRLLISTAVLVVSYCMAFMLLNYAKPRISQIVASGVLAVFLTIVFWVIVANAGRLRRGYAALSNAMHCRPLSWSLCHV
jgi:4-amino-4-deoxy-L-arabinose transferase-like glycosyltransferase